MIRVTFLFVLMLICIGVRAQEPTFQQLLEVGLPLVEIVTIDGEEPSCDYVLPPEGLGGQTIDNATKVPGRLRKWSGGACVYDSGDYMADSCGMRIKIRGNTSAYEPKKSFKVKLEQKADLLCRENDSIYGDKEWLLMKEDYNIEGGELLYLMIGLKTSELCGMPWEPKAEFVNLLLNGDYRGVYMLCEPVKRGGKNHVQVDKSTGYVIEQNPYWWKEDIYFVTDKHRKKFTFKYPDPDEVDSTQVAYIKDVCDEVENAIWNGSFDTYFDVENMSVWLMAHDILGTWDAAGSNVYLTKYDDTDNSKMRMGPLWDFGSIMRMSGQWSAIHTSEVFYFRYLLEMAAAVNAPIINACQLLWETRGQYVPDEMISFLNDFLVTDEAEALQVSNEWDMARWEHPNPSVEEMVQKAINWFRERKEWLSNMYITLGIGHTDMVTSKTRLQPSTRYYDLMGRSVSHIGRGIRIKVENKAGKIKKTLCVK